MEEEKKLKEKEEGKEQNGKVELYMEMIKANLRNSFKEN